MRLLVAAGGLAFIVYAINWQDYTDAQGSFHEGVVTTLRRADPKLLALGGLLVWLIYPILVVRWWLLLRARQLGVSLWTTFRLVMVGCFFNYAMPGTTGGDLVKIFYAARSAGGRRADAVVSVVVDRFVGLGGLVVLTASMGLFMRHEALVRQVSLSVTGLALLGVLCAAVYVWSWPRRVLKLDRALHRLPGGKFLAGADAAVVAYRHHLPTLALALALATCLHLVLALSTAVAGYAFGIQAPLGLLLAILPVLFLCAAIPISPQGLGTTELLATVLLVQPGTTTANQMLGMLLMFRLYQVFYSLLGSVFLLQGDIRMHPEE